MKVLGIVGSPRPGGSTNFLVQEALNEINKAGIETEKIVVSQQKIGFCQCHDDCGEKPSCYIHDDMTAILDKVINADGIILGSPTFFHNVSAQMKVFIDRNRHYHRQKRMIKARSAGVITLANGSGMESARDILKRFLKSVSDVPQDRILTVIGTVKPPLVARANPELIEQAREMGRLMARELKA